MVSFEKVRGVPFELNEVKRRIAGRGETELMEIGFRYVRTMFCPSSENLLLFSKGFSFRKSAPHAWGLGRGRAGRFVHFE